MGQPKDFEGLRPANVEKENSEIKETLIKEFGMLSSGTSNADLDPELENEFLRHILEFEKQFKDCKTINVFEKIGSPLIIPLSDLDLKDVSKQNRRLLHLLDKHNIIVDFCDGPYPDADIYKFLSEELMQLEINDMNIEGMNSHFIYEEFHPNHKADITRIAEEFFECWMNRNLTAEKPPLSKFLISPGGNRFTEEHLLNKLHNFFSSYSRLELDEMKINHVEFELTDAPFNDLTGMGFAEGEITYRGTLESGEPAYFGGMFKIFVSRKCDFWCVNSFIMPGFFWDNKHEARPFIKSKH